MATGKQEINELDLIEKETQKRVDQYYSYMPGTEECEVKPFTLKQMFPAIIIAVGVTALYIYAVFAIYPSYY